MSVSMKPTCSVEAPVPWGASSWRSALLMAQPADFAAQ